MILAPLRGVTTRCFRRVFAKEIAQAGFTEAVTPFISATPGLDPLKDRELSAPVDAGLPTTPQFIGKDPAALRCALERIKCAGYATADLNCGCPFPMVRNKGRGSGLLRTPDVLRRMLEVGCEVMGDGAFSVKARLGVERNDELLALMPLLNCFPLRRLVVHARNARQMYEGECDKAAFSAISAASAVPVVYNGDAPLPSPGAMVGRAFIRWLGGRADACELLDKYIAASLDELGSERPVIGRIKELAAYWKEIPRWRRLWPAIKISRTLAELRSAVKSESIGQQPETLNPKH